VRDFVRTVRNKLTYGRKVVSSEKMVAHNHTNFSDHFRFD